LREEDPTTPVAEAAGDDGSAEAVLYKTRTITQLALAKRVHKYARMNGKGCGCIRHFRLALTGRATCTPLGRRRNLRLGCRSWSFLSISTFFVGSFNAGNKDRTRGPSRGMNFF